jgi:signal transduction histidine kinase
MPTVPQARRRVRAAVSGRLDVAIALGLLVVTSIDMATRTLQPGQHPADLWGYLLVAGMSLPFVLHRRAPLTTVAVVLGLLVVYALVPYSAYPGLVAFVLLFAVAAHSDRRRSVIALVATLAALTVAVAVQPAGIVDRSTWVSTELATVVAWLAGDNLRQRRARTAALHERADALERERDDRARRAVVEERLRIARELHDVVAHSMSVIAVQSGVGRHVIATQPDEAERALAAIETVSRGALVEMRHLLGVLREEGVDPDARAPAPGLVDLDRLVAQVGDAGVRVRLQVEGEPVALPQGVDLSAYRIVQEALTNVIKHGGPTADVTVSYRGDSVLLEVTDEGDAARGGPAWGQPPAAVGHGLIGMRERVAVYGGELTADARPGGGFRIAVRLPLPGELS